ncbi:MAG TPA: hypothetical protein VM694_29540, partial [Polyangium sp.]|nr:hypothetical protein [Polyangium sp.]
ARGGRGVAAGEVLPACTACPADALAAEIPRINRALAGIDLVSVPDPPWPVFFTKREACVEMARKRAAEAQRAE